MPAIIVHTLQNTTPRIETLYAFLSVDEGGEGLMGATINGMLTALITADEKRLPMFSEIAAEIAAATGKGARLVKFTAREEIA